MSLRRRDNEMPRSQKNAQLRAFFAHPASAPLVHVHRPQAISVWPDDDVDMSGGDDDGDYDYDADQGSAHEEQRFFKLVGSHDRQQGQSSTSTVVGSHLIVINWDKMLQLLRVEDPVFRFVPNPNPNTNQEYYQTTNQSGVIRRSIMLIVELRQNPNIKKALTPISDPSFPVLLPMRRNASRREVEDDQPINVFLSDFVDVYDHSDDNSPL
jgi:hypothetical protein